MSWTDEEIDKLARESATNSSVEYKNEYWTEFEQLLPASGKKDFLWFFTAFLFVGIMGTSFVFNEFSTPKNTVVANENGTKNNVVQGIDKSKNETTNSTSTTENQTNETEKINSSPTNNSVNKAVSEKQLRPKVTRSVASKSLKERKINPSTTAKKDENFVGKTPELPKDIATSNETDYSTTQNEESFLSALPLRTLDEFTTNTSLLPGMEWSKQKMPARAAFYVNALGGISQSLITPSSAISTSFGLGLGAQIQKGRFTFTTGVNGVWSNHNDLNLSRSAKVYSFGSKEYNYELKYTQIYSLEAELTAGYKMGRHLINVGVRPSFVVGTKVGLVETVNDEKTIDRNEYGYIDGLYRFGIKPTVGYSFDITNSLKIGVNVGVEMMPKIRDGYLTGKSNKFPIDGQLYLRKSIRFKR